MICGRPGVKGIISEPGVGYRAEIMEFITVTFRIWQAQIVSEIFSNYNGADCPQVIGPEYIVSYGS